MTSLVRPRPSQNLVNNLEKTDVPSHACENSLKFSKKVRMPDAATFSAVFACRPVQRSKHFVLYLKENNLGHARLGLTCSKRFCKRASERNLLKRVMRETFRQQLPSLASVDILLRLSSGFSRTEFLSRSALKVGCYAEVSKLISLARITNFGKIPRKK